MALYPWCFLTTLFKRYSMYKLWKACFDSINKSYLCIKIVIWTEINYRFLLSLGYIKSIMFLKKVTNFSCISNNFYFESCRHRLFTKFIYTWACLVLCRLDICGSIISSCVVIHIIIYIIYINSCKSQNYTCGLFLWEKGRGQLIKQTALLWGLLTNTSTHYQNIQGYQLGKMYLASKISNRYC